MIIIREINLCLYFVVVGFEGVVRIFFVFISFLRNKKGNNIISVNLLLKFKG